MASAAADGRIEGCAIVAACRGDWPAALDGIEEMRMSAARDGDQRYLLLAYREQAFLELQNGRFDEAERILPLIKAEIDRGIKAEEIVTRQDYHAIAARWHWSEVMPSARRRGGCCAGRLNGPFRERQLRQPLLDDLPGRTDLSQSLAHPGGNGLGIRRVFTTRPASRIDC